MHGWARERDCRHPATGDWRHELTPEGDEASGTWSGQPDASHPVQLLLLDRRPVRGSLAAACH